MSSQYRQESISFSEKILQSPARQKISSPTAQQELMTRTGRKRSREAYRDALIAQMREQNQSKIDQKAKMRQSDQLDVEIYQRNFKFGVQQGGGAPLIARDGSPITRVQSIARIQETGAAENSSRSPSPDIETQRRPSPNHSPTKQEMVHMRPSNRFAEITEEQFSRAEASKSLYKRELLEQIEQARSRRETEKERKRLQDIEDDQRIYNELGLPQIVRSVSPLKGNNKRDASHQDSANEPAQYYETNLRAYMEPPRRSQPMHNILNKLNELSEEIQRKNQRSLEENRKIVTQLLGYQVSPQAVDRMERYQNPSLPAYLRSQLNEGGPYAYAAHLFQ